MCPLALCCLAAAAASCAYRPSRPCHSNIFRLYSSAPRRNDPTAPPFATINRFFSDQTQGRTVAALSSMLAAPHGVFAERGTPPHPRSIPPRECRTTRAFPAAAGGKRQQACRAYGGLVLRCDFRCRQAG